jgi:hypothetical protein
MAFEWLAIPLVMAETSTDGMWGAIVGVAAFVMGFGYAIVLAIIKHRERMARIGMGIDPDADPQDSRASLKRPHDPTSQVGG